MTVKNYDLMLNELYNAITEISSVEECKLFLEDLCTIKELESMSQRLRSAKMMLNDKTYNEIIDETSISSATLSRVSRCVRHGKGGYKAIIDKVDKK